jgi:hypothetical protein
MKKMTGFRQGTRCAMYEQLSTHELTTLQGKLYAAPEKAYSLGIATAGRASWSACYQPFYMELGNLFIQAGGELLLRLGQGPGTV